MSRVVIPVDMLLRLHKYVPLGETEDLSVIEVASSSQKLLDPSNIDIVGTAGTGSRVNRMISVCSVHKPPA